MANVSKLMVLDVDDLLVHISTPWILGLTSRSAFEPILKETLPSDPVAVMNEVLSRRIYSLQNWLVEEKKVRESHILDMELSYRANATFYDNLPPTRFAEAVIAGLKLPGRIEHVHLISHCFDVSDPCVFSKERWIRRHLGGPERITIHFITNDVTKPEIMRQHCPEPDAFADDSLSNVISVLLDNDVKPSEILIPLMGHNAAPLNVFHLAALRLIEMTYYQEAT